MNDKKITRMANRDAMNYADALFVADLVNVKMDKVPGYGEKFNVALAALDPNVTKEYLDYEVKRLDKMLTKTGPSKLTIGLLIAGTAVGLHATGYDQMLWEKAKALVEDLSRTRKAAEARKERIDADEARENEG